MLEIHFCKGCGEEISGRYLSALGGEWHPEHFCCAICGQPVGEPRYYLHEGRPCHTACYERSIAPRCTICDKPLLGEHNINYWGERTCLEHAGKLAACSFCGRLLPHTSKRMARRAHEAFRCDICASTAVENILQVKLLLPHLTAWLSEQGLRLRQRTFRVEVLEREDFMAREGGRRDPLGLTTSTRTMKQGRVDHAKLESVAILSGLPHTLFEGVCIHELGHVWLLQQQIVNLPIIEEEGFCELLAHRHYTAVGSKADLFYARRISENDDLVYGKGFRKLQALEERLGLAQIVSSLHRKKKLPS